MNSDSHTSEPQESDNPTQAVLVFYTFQNLIALLNQMFAMIEAGMEPFSPHGFECLLNRIHQAILTKCPEDQHQKRLNQLSPLFDIFVNAIISFPQDIQEQNRAFIREMCNVLCRFAKTAQIKNALTLAMIQESEVLFEPLLISGAPVPLQNCGDLDDVSESSVAGLLAAMLKCQFKVTTDQLAMMSDILISKWTTLHCVNDFSGLSPGITFRNKSIQPLESEHLRSIFLSYIQLKNAALIAEFV